MELTIFYIGLLGSLVLVGGAAWPEKPVSANSTKAQNYDTNAPLKSTKNWLFAVGGFIMLLYSILGFYFLHRSIFFVLLESLVLIASVMMMVDLDDKIDAVVMSFSSLGFILASLFLFEDYSTVLFILGLGGIGMGYAFKMGTIRRNLALLLGSFLIAVFSYLKTDWIFFWLNAFFGLFSLYYLLKVMRHKKRISQAKYR